MAKKKRAVSREKFATRVVGTVMAFSALSWGWIGVQALTTKAVPEEVKYLAAVTPEDSPTGPTKTVIPPIVEVPAQNGPAEVEARIRALAAEAGFRWPDYLVRLAKCESGLRADATNTRGNNPSWSVDRGVFQWNSYWQSGVSDECAFDIDCATKKTMEKINAGGQHIWVCDRYI